jgi:hypothetical protein
MSSPLAGFSQMVLAHFDWLQRTYHFRIWRSGENEVVFTSPFCQVTVALERGDLFVELASNEHEPIRRIKFSLNELLAASSVGPPPQPGQPRSPDPALAERLRIAATLLAQHGGEVLRGDFSIRPRIVELQVQTWLEAKYQDVMEKRRYPTMVQGFQQVALEIAGQSEEKRAEAHKQLNDWTSASVVSRRSFAEQVLACRQP